MCQFNHINNYHTLFPKVNNETKNQTHYVTIEIMCDISFSS